LGNANRGRLAEYIVARALGLGVGDVRNEWDVVDLVTSTGTKIEVKSAAYTTLTNLPRGVSDQGLATILEAERFG
jgi:hypothetical protein